MKRLVLAVALALATPLAQAAPPTAAQVDALLQAMEAPKTMDGILAQMSASSQQMGQSMLGAAATDEQRARLDRVMQEQDRMLREAMRWETLAPIYRSVYIETFSADEVEAMTRFYASPEGRSIMAKLPQAMARTMQAMQPMMQALMQQVQESLQKELAAPPAPPKAG
jgi:hypothetical protein